MQIQVNGEVRDVAEETTVTDLLALLGLDSRFLAVERNRQLIPRAEHPNQRLEENDQIEIVTLVGGG